MRKQKFNGVVYMVINCINGKRYIGRDSYNSAHYFGGGVLIKQAVKKYGKANFIKIVLRKCDTLQNLIKWEKYYLCLYDATRNQNLYNLSMTSEGTSMGIPVYQYELSGGYIRGFESISEACRVMGVHNSTIAAVIRGRAKTSCGYCWSTTKSNHLNFVTPKRLTKNVFNKAKPVCSYDHNGKYLNTYKSCYAASKALGIHHTCITNCCLGRSKYSHGLFFSYKRKKKLSVLAIRSTKTKVVQYDFKNNRIGVYDSLADAYRITGTPFSSICAVIHGKHRHSHGFIWKYEEVAV